YLIGTRKTVISNDRPIIGDYGVNSEGSGDMYSKGANMLHTLRSIVNNDKKWWELLKSFHETFKHQIVNSQDVINFFTVQSALPLEPVFNQYLRSAQLPKLELKAENGSVFYRWVVDYPHFQMPVDAFLSGTRKRLYPTAEWQALKDVTNLNQVKIDTDNFYITVTKIKPSE